jgi:hypothetical protein
LAAPRSPPAAQLGVELGAAGRLLAPGASVEAGPSRPGERGCGAVERCAIRGGEDRACHDLLSPLGNVALIEVREARLEEELDPKA